MKVKLIQALLFALLLPAYHSAWADRYADTVAMFKNAGQSSSYFADSYGYAVFPVVGKAGFGVGGARGTGRVYAQGRQIGETAVTQLSFGLQAGAQGYAMMIFFQDERALKEFTSGNFEFGADVGAVAITAAASGSVGTTGSTGSASGGSNNAATAGGYHKGMAVFTIAHGGAMVEAVVKGQKFSFKPQLAESESPGSTR
jgi:lipid-binding SYLF domain-containing protein